MLALACSASFARAQPAAPRIGYIYPAGGMRGTTVQVIVGGQALAGVKDVYAPGLDGTVIEYTRPLSPKEQTELRDERGGCGSESHAHSVRSPHASSPGGP